MVMGACISDVSFYSLCMAGKQTPDGLCNTHHDCHWFLHMRGRDS